MIKRRFALALSVAVLASMTAIAADPVLDTWQPSVQFKLDFGGQPKTTSTHFIAKMSLSEQAVNKIYGGNTLLQAARAIKGEGTGELPAYLKLDYHHGKTFTTQWMGNDMFHYDYASEELTAPMMLSFLGPFNTADSWAMIITGSMIGTAGMGYGIAQWTSSRPPAAAATLKANGAACAVGAECASGSCCLAVCAVAC
ncbi:MAG: hypothetical protein AABY95_03260 [Pseudomonadota bacterium]